MAGKFAANGAGGIAQTNTILDVNDNGISDAARVVTTSDTSLHGTYQFDPVFSGTGRGTITLTSDTTRFAPVRVLRRGCPAKSERP